MVRTIVQNCLQVNNGIAGKRTMCAGLSQTLFNCGEEVLGNGAAEYFFCEYQIFFIEVGLEANPNITELAAAAGLFLMTTLLLNGLADLLTIRYASGAELSLNIEAALQLASRTSTCISPAAERTI